MTTAPPSPAISRRTFQVVALATLPLPLAATCGTMAKLPRFLEGSDVALAARPLMAALVLLCFVIAWTALLLPLRRRSALPPLARGLADVSVDSIGAAYATARFNLHVDATAASSGPRRRYHLRMAAAGALVAVVTGVLSGAMVTDPSGVVLLWFPIAAVVSASLASYHLIRGLLLRPG